MTEPLLRVGVPGGAGAEYPVYVGRGLFARLGELVAETAPAHRHVIIADEKVAGLYGAAAADGLGAAGLTVDLLTFPAGEAHKTREVWSDLTDRMLDGGAGRDSAVVALGGGVTGDLAGFVASTYMRGIPLVGVPTSLLAMLDSSIGGKTGVDAPTAKNAVGTFHQPLLVVVDPDLLATLPAAHRRAGLAEAVKIAAIRDARFFAWIESHAAALARGDPSELEALVADGVRLKAAVVVADPLEEGFREVLNFGHTAGHALETLAGFALLHGEAVAAGMRIEARLGEATGVTERGTARRIDAALAACGLPDVLSVGTSNERFGGAVTGERILEAASVDKKSRAGQVRWVLPARIGEIARERNDEVAGARAGGMAGAGRSGWSHAIPAPEAVARLDEALRAIGDVRDSAS